MIIDWIRHTTLDIEEGICYGHTDVEVSRFFEQEAQRVKERLKDQEYDAVFSSPLIRARRLASYCGFPDAKLDERLKEFNFGDWEMRPWMELFDVSKLTDDDWFANWHQIQIPGGETLEGMIERVRSFIVECNELGYQHICCFCHGGVINCAQYISGEIGVDDVFRINPDYGELVRLEYSDPI